MNQQKYINDKNFFPLNIYTKKHFALAAKLGEENFSSRLVNAFFVILVYNRG